MTEGDNITVRCTVRNKDGSLRDIQNHTGRLVVSHWEGGQTVFEITDSDAQWTFTDPANGEFQVEFDETDTEGIVEDSPEEFYFEIELTDEGDVDYTVTSGTITVTPSN